jgi:hypothetical protein
MGKRRTSDEICKALKNSRSKIYRERTNLIKQQKSGKLSARKMEASNKKIKALSVKIDKYASRIFKCGKKYAKLKQAKASMLLKISYLKKKLKDNRDMSKSERNKILTEITELNATVIDLGVGMGKEVMELKRGRVGFVPEFETGELIEDVVIWQVKTKVEGLISGGRMLFLEVNGESYSLELNAVSALWAVDDYVADVTASQRDRNVKTPTIRIIINFITNTVTIE